MSRIPPLPLLFSPPTHDYTISNPPPTHHHKAQKITHMGILRFRTTPTSHKETRNQNAPKYSRQDVKAGMTAQSEHKDKRKDEQVSRDSRSCNHNAIQSPARAENISTKTAESSDSVPRSPPYAAPRSTRPTPGPLPHRSPSSIPCTTRRMIDQQHDKTKQARPAGEKRG